jgi:mxaA protein
MAQDPGPGWAQAPDVRQHDLIKEGRQPIPGWSAVLRPNPNVQNFKVYGPRAFGLLTGDKVRHQLHITVAKPYRLQRSSLPPSQWLNTWLELQHVRVAQAQQDRRTRYVITIDYQIFSTPRAVTFDVIPGFDLRFGAKDESFKLAVPAWTFSISPLLKPEPEVQAVAEIPLRADVPPPRVDAAQSVYGLEVFGFLSAVCAVLGLYLAGYGAFGRRGKAPFAKACRRLRALRRSDDDEGSLHQGFRVVHQAFNETAGQVVFAEHLERFFASRPSFASRRASVETFFTASRQLFFDERIPSRSAIVDMAGLESLCRQWRTAERRAR